MALFLKRWSGLRHWVDSSHTDSIVLRHVGKPCSNYRLDYTAIRTPRLRLDIYRL
jgi:hypothetical protein